MTAVEMREVQTLSDRRTFLTFPWRIYKDDPLWVPPLIPQREQTIDPEQGVFFQRGEADFFVAWRDGEPVGTICAAEDPPTNEARGKRECLFGFFEYVEDEQVFEALVQQTIAWAQERGLNALFGPFNLDYEDSYGVLLEGRDRPPALMCGHTPPYYQDFMEHFGFQAARGDNLAYAIYPDAPGLSRLWRVADLARRRWDITIRNVDLGDWDAEIDRIHHLLNASLSYLPDHIGWQRDALESLLAPFRQIADPELILFAEVGGEPVGWLPAIPNLNEIFIHVNGLRRPWDYLKLWWHSRQQVESLTLKSVVVLPEYWNRGVGVLLFEEMAQRVLARGYQWVDLSLTSADNPNVPILAEHMGAKIYKRYRVYRLYL